MAIPRLRVPFRQPEIFLDEEAPAPIPYRRGTPINTLAGDLAAGAATQVPLSARERESNAERARIRAARTRNAERSGYEVSPMGLIRELGDVASLYGAPGLETAADTAAGALSTVGGGLLPRGAQMEYDPVALGSSFNPLSDEAIGAIEALRGGSYREAQSDAEQRFEQAQEASPFSSAAGAISSLAALGPAMEGAGAARFGGAGAALGGAGGFLGTEGESWGRRAVATGRGALLGGALGAGAGRLNALGAGMRAAAPTSFGNAVARGALGTGLESAGQSVALGALGSGGRVTDPLYEGGRFSELLADPAAGGAGGFVGGALLGIPGGVARGARLARAPVTRTPGLASDLTGEIDEGAQEIGQYLDDAAEEVAAPSANGLADFDPRAVIAANPAPERSAAETILGVSMEDPAIATIKAGSGMDRAVQRQAARVFGGGQRGAERAAAAIEDAGIFTPGETTTLGETVRRAELVRDAARADLAARHAAVAERGGVIPGNQVADALEAEAARLEAPGRNALPEPMRNRIDDLRTRANQIRYGTDVATADLGRAAQRIETAPTLAPEDVLEELPGLADERELVGLPTPQALRRMARPAVYPYQSGRRIMGDVSGLARTFAPGQTPAPGTTRELLQTEYNAWVPARNRAAERALSPDEYAAMQRANRTYRIAETLAPSDAIASGRLRSEGLLRGALARTQGGPLAFLRGLAERSYAQHEPSVQAAIAHGIVPSTPATRALAGRLGGYADRLAMPAEAAAAIPASVASASEPRRVVEAQRAADSEAAAQRALEAEDEEQGGLARFAQPAADEPLTPEEEEEQGGFARFAR